MKTITLIWPEGEIDALGPAPSGGGFQFVPRDIDQEDDVDTGDGVMIITPWHEEAWDSLDAALGALPDQARVPLLIGLIGTVTKDDLIELQGALRETEWGHAHVVVTEPAAFWPAVQQSGWLPKTAPSRWPLYQKVENSPLGLTSEDLAHRVKATIHEIADDLGRLKAEGTLLSMAGHWMTQGQYTRVRRTLELALLNLHELQPREIMFPATDVVVHAGLPFRAKVVERIFERMVTDGLVRMEKRRVAHAEFRPDLQKRTRELLDRALRELELCGPNAPTVPELASLMQVPSQAVSEILRIGLEAGEVVMVDEERYMGRAQILRIVEDMKAKLDPDGFRVGEFRDALESSRKFAVPLLEWLNKNGLTRREGERHIFVD